MEKGLKTEKENQNPLDQVILGIAHELNNPNAFIRLNAMNLKKMFWLLRPCLDEYQKNHPDAKFGPYELPELRAKMSQQIESILDATVRLIVIADKFKHCTTESLEQSSDISLLDIITNIIRDHTFILNRSARVAFSFSEDKPCRIEGYRLQMEQALSVLLTNACDAIVERFGETAGQEAGRIDITLSEEADTVTITIADNGCGMEPKTLEKVFVPYFTTKPQGMGDGLGLAIARSIINRHKGSINISSTMEIGTEITMQFPLKQLS